MFLGELDFSMIPTWLVLAVMFLAIVLPLAIRWARGHDHPDLAADLEQANKVITFLTDAITRSDHTGSVAAHVEANAEKHGVDEHPAVQKITS